MSNRNSVRSFLAKLESSASRQPGLAALRQREEMYIEPYKRSKCWPGESYIYLGHSQNLDHQLLGTTQVRLRSRCMTLLFEAKGDANYCVSLENALDFEGFFQSLSRFEKEFLDKLPTCTVLGPAYDRSGSCVPGAFAVWRKESQRLEAEGSEAESEKRVLIKV